MRYFLLQLLLAFSLISNAGTLCAQVPHEKTVVTEFNIARLEKQVQQVLAKVKPATVAIFMRDDRNMAGATGVLVSKDGLILTAGHCVENRAEK